MRYDTGKHTVFYHRFHIVWITKYRYKVLRGKLRERVRIIIRQVWSWTGAKSRDGSPGNLGDPALARGQRGWKGDCQRENPDPGPSPGLYGDGSAP